MEQSIFANTYDSNGNAMRYNGSANIGGYTAGGTGNYKYRMFVDGETAFCIQPGVPLKTGNTLKKASSENLERFIFQSEKRRSVLHCFTAIRETEVIFREVMMRSGLPHRRLYGKFVTGCRESDRLFPQDEQQGL